jgi:protein O-mannosyl-transferase
LRVGGSCDWIQGKPLFLIGVKISRTTLVGVALAIFAGTLWLHWPDTRGGFLTNMDDDENLQAAIRCKGLTWQAVTWAFTTTEPYYQPLPRLSHVVDYQLWGTNAAGHHAASVIVHALNAALLFGFLWTMLAAVSLSTVERLMLATGVAVAFAIHPLQVESVAWMSGRTQLLCTTFGIGCLWAYVAKTRRWVVWILFGAALLCKPMAVALPFAMLILDFYPLRRYERTSWSRLFGEKAVLIAVCVFAAVATAATESNAGGLMVRLDSVPVSQRLWLMFYNLAFYPWKLLWPASLSPYYPLGEDLSLSQPPILASILFVVAITATSVWCRRRVPAVGAAWMGYAVFILPVSGLLQTGGQTVASRYAYLAMVPLLLLAGATVVWLSRRTDLVTHVTLATAIACELVFFAWAARIQIPVWRNDESLWRTVLAQFPDSDFAERMLAQSFDKQDRPTEALELWMQSSPEQHAARAVAVGYARSKGLDTDLLWKNGGLSSQLRGKYKPCFFVFEPRNDRQPVAILIRYDATCATDTFEVGVVNRTDSSHVTPDTTIANAEHIAH